MQHIHCPSLCKGNSLQVPFLFFLLYQQTKPAVFLSQKLQPKVELHTKCLISYSENAGNSLYAESNFQIHGASCFIIYGSDHLEAQTIPVLAALASYAEIVSICYFHKTGYSSKEEYSPQLQTTGMLDVRLWEVLPKPTPPFSLGVNQILPTITSMQICNNSTDSSQDLYRYKTIQNLAPGLFH